VVKDQRDGERERDSGGEAGSATDAGPACFSFTEEIMATLEKSLFGLYVIAVTAVAVWLW
jgi:hypothetical protein